ncbi:MAG: type IV secretory system conjugative DNA transfer family protein [Gammaproteobacteria bacterium]|jgi:type IV secretion system protein VirD4|nr:type IV secretory system conjugative DNA transfer family protein [Gammaproteobacteria bacterium]
MLRLVQSAKADDHRPPSQLILGWEAERRGASPWQDAGANARPAAWRPIADGGEGHLMTIAPTGSGKGRSVIIPTLLSYPGPVIVIDPKGENYEVTARRRHEMGHRVFLLDPFRMTRARRHDFNVLDQIQLHLPEAYDQAVAMAELLVPRTLANDPFWDDSARSLVAALILWVVEDRLPEDKTLMAVVDLLHAADLRSELGRMCRSRIRQVRQVASGFRSTECKVMANILSVARTAVSVFNGNAFGDMSERTDIPLDGIVAGDPISIYLVLPPDKLDSHGRLIRLWIGCLMDQLGRRRHRVARPTLFMLDEAAQLGSLDQLRRAITLMRGYGVRTWSFWQDLSQLERLYPDWETLYNNTRYVQTFGVTTRLLARKLGALLELPDGIDPLTMPANRLVLAEAGRAPRLVGKPDYRHDPVFAGLFDDNPFYRPVPTPSRAAASLDTESRPERFKHRATERREAQLSRWDHITEADCEPDPEPERPWWDRREP